MSGAALPIASVSSQVSDGPFLAAAAIAAAAGLVSFLSPCVLPLVPGYLSFVTSLSATQLAGNEAADGRRRSLRIVVAGLLFVLGFTVVFVAFGALAGTAGALLRDHQLTLQRVLGVVTIVLGLAFAGALNRVSFFGRELRLHALPKVGIAGAPALGAMFALGWTPCIGPTLATVLGLAASTDGTSAARGTALAFAYCLGLGLPFMITGLAFQTAMGAFAVVRRRYRALMVFGGAMLVAIGVLEATGTWATAVAWLQSRIGSTSLPL